MTNSSASPARRRPDAAYPYAMARNTSGMLGNLISHVCRMANNGWWQSSNDPVHPISNLTLSEQNLMSLLSSPGGYLRAAQYLAQLLSPETACHFGAATNLAKVRTQLSLLVCLWDEVVLNGTDPELATRAVAFAKQIIVRSPEDASSFVGECCEILGVPEAMSLIAAASYYAKSDHDMVWITHAQEQVTQVIRAKCKAAPPETSGKPDKAPSSVLVKEEDGTHTARARKTDDSLLAVSQVRAKERLAMICDLFFGDECGPFPESGLKLRLFPLLVGPTGVGKTRIIKDIAQVKGAEYFKVTRGDMIPIGARVGAGESTTFTILDILMRRENVRLLLHMDELDKLTNIEKGGSDWGASQQTDIWNILDGDFPFEAYRSARAGLKLTEAQMREKVRKSLWIVGSGTWQALFENSRKASMGFVRSESTIVNTGAVRDCRQISSELLARFNSDIMFLDYPDIEETRRLLELTGIDQVAASLGIVLRPESVDWTKGGMRVLESLKTDLSVEFVARNRKADRPAVARVAA